MIPPSVLCRQDLSPVQKILLGRIIGLLTADGYCYASNRWLGEQIGIAKQTTANILSDLQKKNYIKIEQIKDEKNNTKERRIFPVIDIDPITEIGNTYYRNREYPITEIGNTPITGIGNQRNRDKRNRERDNILSKVSKTFDEGLRLASLLYAEILINETSVRISKITEEKDIKKIIESWAKDIEKLIRIDQQNPSIVEEVIRWCQQDGFWGPNVLSGRKLREKWDTLVARKKQSVSISRQGVSMQKKKLKEEDLDAHRLAVLQGLSVRD